MLLTVIVEVILTLEALFTVTVELRWYWHWGLYSPWKLRWYWHWRRYSQWQMSWGDIDTGGVIHSDSWVEVILTLRALLTVTVEVVVLPQLPNAGSTSHVPQCNGVVVVENGLHIEPHRRLCLHKIPQGQFV